MRTRIRAFDRKTGAQVDRLPRNMRPVMNFFTLIGQPPFTVGIAAAILGYGWALDKPFYEIAGAFAIATIAICSLLKVFLRRARPVNEYVEKMPFKTFSFPSGHAAGAFVSFGLAALVISYRWPEFAVIAWILALISTFMVGISRIYLGAHYTSDVVGGWILGGAGLAAILTIAR